MKKLLTLTLLFLSYFSFSQCDSISYEFYPTFKKSEKNIIVLTHNHSDKIEYVGLIVSLYKYNNESNYNPNIKQWQYLGKGKIIDDKDGFKIKMNHDVSLKSLKPFDKIKIEWKEIAKTEKIINLNANNDTLYYGNLSCNKKIGTWKYFYPNNKLKNITNYNQSGDLDGVYKIYHKEGGYLYEEGNYKNGKLDGIVHYYHPNGKIKKEIPFKDGKRDGTVTKFYLNGNIQYIEHYKDGKICCEAKDFYENGKPKITTYYKNSKLDSSYIFYYENGNIKTTQYYKEGKRHGDAALYYENGQIQEKTTFKNGKQDGIFESYYENGQLKAKGNYLQGKKFGLWVQYYENGKKKSKGSFTKDGVKTGKWIDWDENGKKTKSVY